MAVEGIVEGDAVSAIASPKLPRDLPGVLTTKQVEALLKTPDTSTPAGLRDAAMLELLYASGARISELAALNVESIAWSERTLRLWGKSVAKVWRIACGAMSAGMPASVASVWNRRRSMAALMRLPRADISSGCGPVARSRRFA